MGGFAGSVSVSVWMFACAYLIVFRFETGYVALSF